MILTALARLGRDAELRFTPKGDAVCELALAINYGRKGDDGNRPTQWLSASMWGQRAQSLAPHLTKGKLVYVVVEEPHIETYQGKNGEGHKLVGRIVSLEFAGGSTGQQEAPRQQAPAQRPQAPQKPASGGGFDSMDDDIPFSPLGSGASWRVI